MGQNHSQASNSPTANSLTGSEYYEGVWYWQSNTDPESQFEIPQWEKYSELDNAKIEDALRKRQTQADLGNCIVIFKDMVQTSKEDFTKRRQVKRIVLSEGDRTTRFTRSIPAFKSLNHCFGSIKDLERMLIVKYQLEGYTKKPIKERRKIIANCIKTEAKKLGAKETKQAKYLAHLLISSSNDNQESFNAILLNLCTQESFLYGRINSLLEGEMWMELKDLAPFLLELIPVFGKTKCDEWLEVELYRGANMDEESLSEYEPRKYFSWNSFTSTTRNRKIAEAIHTVEEGYTRVLFTIVYGEAENKFFRSALETLKAGPQLLDASKVSQFPEEDEVLIAPGSLFRVVAKTMIDEICYITLQHWDYVTVQICDLLIKREFGRAGILSNQEVSWENFKKHLTNKKKSIEVALLPEKYSDKAHQLLIKSPFIEELTLHNCDETVEEVY